jgi:hypothetical protein
VTFGRRQSYDAVLTRLDAWRLGQDPAGIKTFDAGTTLPLRFCSDDGVRFPPTFLADISDAESKLARLKSDVSRHMDVFARNPRRLLDRYFDFIGARLNAERAALDASLQPLGGLFRVEDWAYAALRPMPNAIVFDADDTENPPVPVTHDIAFWTGQTVLAIRVSGSGTPPPRELEARHRLQGMGVDIVTIPAADLAAGREPFSDSRFPLEFRNFWHGAPYPCSPFRPQGLPFALPSG